MDLFFWQNDSYKIYVSKRIKASGGQIFGLTKDCEVASTVYAS